MGGRDGVCARRVRDGAGDGGSESPVPAVTQTASPGALPVTGAEK